MAISHTFVCSCCGGRFKMNCRLKVQHYCSSPLCQQARKNVWEKQRRHSCPSYAAQRVSSRKKWYHAYPGHRYQREYRERHEDYVLSNRKQQRLRHGSRVNDSLAPKIVKTDTLSSGIATVSGLYQLLPYRETGGKEVAGKIVKTDALIVEIRSTSGLGELFHERSP